MPRRLRTFGGFRRRLETLQRSDQSPLRLQQKSALLALAAVLGAQFTAGPPLARPKDQSPCHCV